MIELQPGISTTRFQPLTWRSGELETMGPAALVSCVNGHIASLIEPDHVITDEGFVHPSVVCPTKDCKWHETIKLAGWQG